MLLFVFVVSLLVCAYAGHYILHDLAYFFISSFDLLEQCFFSDRIKSNNDNVSLSIEVLIPQFIAKTQPNFHMKIYNRQKKFF